MAHTKVGHGKHGEHKKGHKTEVKMGSKAGKLKIEGGFKAMEHKKE
jgi:hypothetical protein